MRDTGSFDEPNVAPSVYSHVSRPGSHRYKNAKKGLPFNLMLRTVVPADDKENPEQAHIAEPMQFKHHSVDMEEDGMRIILNIIDTPGFGDGLDNENCFTQITEYLEAQFDDVLAEENRIKRNPKSKDSRLDIELMKRLGYRANIIPVIGRSDTAERRQRIMADIAAYNIPVFNFPNSDDDDEETVEENLELRALMPFAVVGCEEVINEDGRPVRVRTYPWGVVQVDNDEHSDFDRLRYVLLNSHIGDLRDRTHNEIYELYRTEKLSTTGGANSAPSGVGGWTACFGCPAKGYR
ncbi:cell division/GTP binding protein, partial [Linderina pennispora]